MTREHLKLEVVRFYYFENLNQNEIARKIGISRSYVSKLLIEARKEKLIEFKSRNPWLTETEEERLLKNHYNLKKVMIVSKEINCRRESVPFAKELGEKLNEFLNTILNNGDVIGVAWGKTIYECSKYLYTDTTFRDVKVVQICGGVSQSQNSTYSSEISKNFADAFHANSYSLPIPAIVESREYKEIFYQEQGIRQVRKVLDDVNIAIFTVGQCSMDSSLVRSGYITEEGIQGLIRDGAIGEVCTHFINQKGQYVSPELDERTVAVPMERLQKCDFRIAVILGKERLEPLKAILDAGYPNVLIIDEETASVLLKETERGREC